MATATKLSSTAEREQTAVSSGLRKDERQTRGRNESDLASTSPGEQSKPERPASFAAADGPDRALIERLAYAYWEERGHPDGSAEEDWFRAESVLRKDFES